MKKAGECDSTSPIRCSSDGTKTRRYPQLIWWSFLWATACIFENCTWITRELLMRCQTFPKLAFESSSSWRKDATILHIAYIVNMFFGNILGMFVTSGNLSRHVWSNTSMNCSHFKTNHDRNLHPPTENSIVNICSQITYIWTTQR